MSSIGLTREHDENNGEPMLTSPGGRTTRKRKMEERDENSLGEPEDFEWENSKENVMPLKRGRKVVDLNRALRTHDSFQGKAKLDQEAKEMEASVHEYSGSDPLSVWVQYVKWIETNMPEDTRKKFTALEKCTRELKEHAQYKNDIRYIRLWIQYADLVSNPKDIFKYLYTNKIGEHVSLFYIGWAMVFESMANYAQAHKVYLKATQKKAQPADLLDRKYKEFQRRMSRHWLKVSNSDSSDTSADGNQRFALEDISTDGADIQRFGNSENFRRYAQVQAEKMQRANAHKPVFTVYEDPAGIEVDPLSTGTDWKKLDTVRHQNKENDSAPTKWNDGALPVQTAPKSFTLQPSTQPSGDALQVFVDEEFAASDDVAPSTLGRDRSLTLRQRLEGASTEEEQLLQQPLKNFTNDKSSKADGAKPPRALAPNKSARERCVYNEEMLKITSGSELCFEEVRARQYAAQVSRKRSTGLANRFLADPTSSTVTHQTASVGAIQSNGSRGTKASAQATNGMVPTLPSRAVQPTIASDSLATLNQAAQEDMTINTRLAMEDVNSMFCSPSRETKEPVVQSTIWEVPEPVERKLHFSIFEDSVDSIAFNPNDVSLRNDGAEQVEKNSFQVFSDDASALQPTAPKTASKMSARKPLTSRDDLARRSRLTNKDMLLQIQTDTKEVDSSER